MTMYTFYCCRPDGAAPAFEAHELGSDAAAADQARRLLGQHASCSHVTVYDGEREVETHRRPGVEPAPPPLSVELAEAIRAAALASSKAAVIVTDPQGAVVFWNDGASKLYGWSAADALGANILDVTPAVQTKRKASAIMDKLLAGEPWEGEITLKRRNGARFTAFVADTPVGRLADGDGAIVGVSAPAEKRSLVWQAQAEILAQLSRSRRPERV